MVKLIELNKNGIGRLIDDKPFLLPEKLELQFVAHGYDLSNAFVSIKNGTVKKHFKVTESKAYVDEDLLFAGYLYIRVQMYLNGELAKTWDVTPIKLVETQFGIECFDYLKIIEEKIDKMKEDVDALKSAHEIIK